MFVNSLDQMLWACNKPSQGTRCTWVAKSQTVAAVSWREQMTVTPGKIAALVGKAGHYDPSSPEFSIAGFGWLILIGLPIYIYFSN